MIRVHDAETGKVICRSDGPLTLDRETLQTATGETIAYFDESIQQWVGRETNQMTPNLSIIWCDS